MEQRLSLVRSQLFRAGLRILTSELIIGLWTKCNFPLYVRANRRSPLLKYGVFFELVQTPVIRGTHKSQKVPF